MSKSIQILLFVVLALSLSGCGKPYTDMTDCDGTLSPDGKARLSVRVNGAPGYAYVNKSEKIIWLWIVDANSDSKEFFRGGYSLTGSDVEWQTYWASADAVSVEFYDWGDGVSNYHNMSHAAASNHIATLSFILNKRTGEFTQRRVPGMPTKMEAKPENIVGLKVYFMLAMILVIGLVVLVSYRQIK